MRLQRFGQLLFLRHDVKLATVPMPSLADLVQRHDPDRFLCSLFAPAGRREALFTLYAFNHELARAHEAAREPGLALIRLQWWREIVEGARRLHEVATPLAEALESGVLPTADLLAMIEARDAEVEQAPTLAELVARLRLGAGSLAAAAGAVLGATREELDALRALGTGVGLSGLLRNLPSNARLGRCQIPVDVLGRFALTPEAVIADPLGDTVAPARAALAAEARAILGKGRHWRREVLAAALPAVFARRDLARPYRAQRGLGDKLSVILSAASTSG
jgi:phytoene synthase